MSVLWHAHLQMEFRISAKIFLLYEVFNTSVDKYVENGVFSQANYTLLSSLTRFALFRCTKPILTKNVRAHPKKLEQ